MLKLVGFHKAEGEQAFTTVTYCTWCAVVVHVCWRPGGGALWSSETTLINVPICQSVTLTTNRGVSSREDANDLTNRHYFNKLWEDWLQAKCPHGSSDGKKDG